MQLSRGLVALLAIALAASNAAAQHVAELRTSRVMPMRGAKQQAGPPVLTAVSLSPDGRAFATGGDDHLVRIWNLNDGSLVRELRGHSDWVRA